MTWKKLNKTKKRGEKEEEKGRGRRTKGRKKETRVLTALSVGIWSQLPVEINEPMLARCERDCSTNGPPSSPRRPPPPTSHRPCREND